MGNNFCSKFYKKNYNGYMNAPMDSVLNNKNVEPGKLFTYNTMSGIPPKLNLDFLNKIAPEATVIFAMDVEFVTSTMILVDQCVK